jgi:hypothetical protein
LFFRRENDMSDSDTAELDSTEMEDSTSNDEWVHLTSSEKILERQRLQSEIEAYLSSGGMIRQIPVNVRADPPRKPESNYGGQPI